MSNQPSELFPDCLKLGSMFHLLDIFLPKGLIADCHMDQKSSWFLKTDKETLYVQCPIDRPSHNQALIIKV